MTTMQLNVSDILVVRYSQAQVEPLPDGLAKKIYNEPIIVRGDRVLVDGLRRLRRAKAEGQTTINAIVSSDYPTLMTALRKQHADAGNQVTPRRLWEIYDQVFALGITWSRSRYNGGWEALPNGQRRRRVVGAHSTENGTVKGLFVQAFDYSASMVGHITHLYRQADGGNLLARELVELVDKGEISPQGAVTKMRRPYNLTGNVVKEDDQRQILQRGSAALAAHVDALAKLAYPIQIPTEELATYYKDMFNARRKLTEMLNGMRKLLKEAEVPHG
jgi:hypothetical protein